MSKPVLDATLITPEEKEIQAKVLVDSGSFYSIIRENLLPEGTSVIRYKTPREFGTAGQVGKVKITGTTYLIIKVGGKMIDESVCVCPDLKSNMLIGSGTMQHWDITLQNKNGKTEVIFGRDMRDPEITEVV